ncbi:hypothetical protein PINS_up006739 [Pythium insidiosum]|nr:hypothetical protein PINS_up006739 [Pythium insidiosum]
MPLPEVFERLQREVAQRSLRSTRVRKAVDVFYFHCLQQVDALSPEFLRRVVDYFVLELFAPRQTPAFVLGETMNEGAFAAMVKLLLAQQDLDAAWRLVNDLCAVSSERVHFRTVGPIVEFLCQRQDFVDAMARWRRLKTVQMEWTPAMEDTLVQLVIACVRHHHRIGGGSVDAVASEFTAQMQELLQDLKTATKTLSAENGNRLRHAFTSAGFVVKSVVSDEQLLPSCAVCHTTLAKDHPTDDEQCRLVDAVETGALLKIKSNSITTKEFLAPFKHWLLSKHAAARKSGRLHYILDGPNIAYLNQNFDAGSFRFDHIDLVTRMLQAQGHEVSITIPFSYLEESSKLQIRTRKFKKLRKDGRVATRRRTDEEKAMIDRWRAENLVFSCRTDYLSDDVFWLYASALLGPEVRVVTNDQGRDHVYALLNTHKTAGDGRERISIDLIERWRESTIVNIEIQHEDLATFERQRSASNGSAPLQIPVQDVRLVHPLPFTRVPQATHDGKFHFPIRTDNGGRRWLCVQRAS